MTGIEAAQELRDVVFNVREDGVLEVVSDIDFDLWKDLSPDMRRYLGADFDVHFNVGAGPYDFWLALKSGAEFAAAVWTVLEPFVRMQKERSDRYHIEVTSEGTVWDATQPPSAEFLAMSERIVRGTDKPLGYNSQEMFPGGVTPLPPAIPRRPDSWVPPAGDVCREVLARRRNEDQQPEAGAQP